MSKIIEESKMQFPIQRVTARTVGRKPRAVLSTRVNDHDCDGTHLTVERAVNAYVDAIVKNNKD